MPKNDCPDDSRAIIEQNNFVNQSLHTIGQHFDRIEEKFSSVSSKEDPLISLPDNRKTLGLKPNSEKTMEKIEAMLSDLKISWFLICITLQDFTHSHSYRNTVRKYIL
jgi:hypothetical protein